ncbi:l-ascorbate oxidase-like protein [Hordeum vulgare]|nr:l-ascorbate oxidase-like protein [Hordeum vulgare]
MEENLSLGLWLQRDGCCNGPTWVAMGFNSLGIMFLRRGWKLFGLAHDFKEGHVLHFKFDGAATLFMKAFRNVGGPLDCCMEGDSNGSSSPSCIDGSGSSSFGGRRGDNDSDGSQAPK